MFDGRLTLRGTLRITVPFDESLLRRRDLLPVLAACLGTKPLSARNEDLTNLEQWLRADSAARKRALASSLRRIRQLDKSIHAWVQVDPQPQTGEGLLSGIPFGVKDVIETQNLVTEFGSPIYKGRRGTGDAVIVRQLKSLGAILFGKTQTAAFAHTTPSTTRNPRNIAHTPGGSSSGSAAAVAAGMVPLAIGTQTGGSVLRPASFCGVTGFKPTYGLLSVDGVMQYSHSLDTLGFFTHTPQDMLLFWKALGQLRGREDNVSLGVVEPLPAGVEPPMAAAIQKAVSLLRSRGIEVKPVPIAAMLDKITAESRVVSTYEGAHAHERRYQEYGSRLQDVAKMVEEGLQIPAGRYQEARAFIAEGKRRFDEIYSTTPVLLVPAATGPAPKGLASTGDSRMNRAWTALGTPAIALPMPVQSTMPMGLQLTAAAGQDSLVLHTAVRIAALF
jgi:Asp-tRNA(Asn)/Glu-tRNA(Gln) amidotransferase A subunit family amidase